MSMSISAYPNPVLGNGDDVDSVWTIPEDRIKISEHTDYIDISFRIECDDPDLKKMVTDGDAEIVARLNCSQTLTRHRLELKKVKNPSGWTCSATIDQQDVVNKVSIDIYAVAARDLTNMYWQRQHSDYGNEHFSVSKGEYLTRPITFDFNIDKLYDPFNPPNSSCINFVVDHALQKTITVRYDDQKLQILLSEEIGNWIKSSENKNKLYAAVILPALVEAISYLHEQDINPGDDNPYEYEWAKVIQQRMEVMNLEKDKPLDAAQALLSDPIGLFASDELSED